MSGLGLHPVLPWPIAVVLGLLLVGVSVAALALVPEHRLRWGLRTGAAVAVAVALLGPGVAGAQAPQASRAINVWFVVDTTSSSVARDYRGDKPRMDGFREDVTKIADALPGARYSVMTFDSAARTTMPLTTDRNALETTMSTLRQEITLYSKGSSVTTAREHLRESLEKSKERYPDRARVVFYLGDGEQTNGQAPEPFDVGDLVDGGAVLGYGTEKGGPMDSLTTMGESDGDIKAPDGGTAVSKLDEGELRKISEQLGVPYVHRDGGDIGPAVEEADAGELTEDAASSTPTHVSLVWIFATLAAALLLVDLWFLVREITRLRQGERA